MLSWFGDILAWVLDQIFALISLVMDWLGDLFDAIVSQLADWAIAALPQGLVDYVNANPWNDSAIISYIDNVAWFVPVYEVGGVILTTVGFVATIRLVRWIIGLVPTIEG